MSCTTATLCPTGCGVAGLPALPTGYYDCSDEITLQYGYCTVLITPCDYVPADILDATAIAAEVAAGRVQAFPFSIVTPNAPSTNAIDLGCGKKINGEVTYTFDIKSPFRDCDGLDSDFWCEFEKNSNFYRVLIIDRNGLALLPDEWVEAIDDAPNTGGIATVAGVASGFGYNVTQIPHPFTNDNGLASWETSIEVIVSGCLRHRKLPDDVLAAFA